MKKTNRIVRAMRERQEYVDYITSRIDVNVLYDTTGNAMETFLEALRMAGGDPCIHMEEDILLTSNFDEKIESVISENKDIVIQFFSMRKKDLTIGSRLESGRTFCMNQCFYLPEGYSTKLLKYYDVWERKDEHPTGYDLMLADMLGSEKYLISVPSLVEHRVCKSLINSRRSAYRQSLTFEE